jgi:purine-nucleoside phosphorylase
MVWDSLSMMKKQGLLKKEDNIVFLGSMGSLTPNIALDDLVVPTEVHYIKTNKERDILIPDQVLLAELKNTLRSSDHRFISYEHGSVRAVFDPTIDHKTYTEKRYKDSVQGIDCSEAYAGLKFCEKNKLYGVVLLYCSDSPTDKIFDIPKEEFDKRALQRDLDMHHIASKVLQKIS